MTPLGILEDPRVETGAITGDRVEAPEAKTPEAEISEAEILRVKAAALGGVAVSTSFASLTSLLSPVEVEALELPSKSEIGLP